MAAQSGAVELFHDARSDLGEGPFWDEASEKLFWLDLFPGEIHTFAPATGISDRVDVGQAIGVFVLRSNGGILAAVRDGLGFVDFESRSFKLVVSVEIENTANRANDGKCDARGRFWYGTMAYDQTPGAGTLYRVDANLDVVPMVKGTTTSNGIDWSPDNRKMYHADTGTRCITMWDFDLEAGNIANPQIVFRAPEGAGSPDGLAVDASGDIWVAMWGGNSVLRLDPAGRLKEKIEIPATYVTSVAFGGKDLDELLITTARRPLDEAARAREPHAGSIYRCRPGVRGRAPFRFQG